MRSVTGATCTAATVDNIFYAFMSGGTSHAASDSLDDWSTVLSSGPHSLPPGDTLRLAWAVVAGDNLADLMANTQAARTRYSGSLALAGKEFPESPGSLPAARVQPGAKPHPTHSTPARQSPTAYPTAASRWA